MLQYCSAGIGDPKKAASSSGRGGPEGRRLGISELGRAPVPVRSHRATGDDEAGDGAGTAANSQCQFTPFL